MFSLSDIASLLTQGTTVLLLCGAIFIWALEAFRRFHKQIAPMQERLTALCDSLEEFQGEQGFAAGLPRIERDIKAVDFMNHPWSEFRETLLAPDIGETPAVYQNTQSAAEFFSLDSLLHERLNLRLYNALPNLFTGVGILGTFVGLVAGIHLASEGLADLTQAHRALESLLGGASLAFFTSIAGLLSSLLFSSREKDWIHRFEQARERWVAGLDSRLKRVTLESVSKQTLVQAKQQTVVLQQFTEQLAFQITEALETKMPAAMNAQVTAPLMDALESVKAAVERISENQQRANDKTIREIVDKLSESMSGAAGQEMREFAGAVKSMGEQLREQISAVSQQQEAVRRQSEESVSNLASVFSDGAEQLQERVSSSVDQILTGLSATIGQMSEQLDTTVGRMSRQLDETGEAFKGAVGDLTGSVESISSILERANKLMKYLDDLLLGARQANAALKASAESMDGAAGRLEATANRTAEYVGKVEETSSELSSAIEHLENIQGTMRQVWEHHEARFEGLDAALGNTFKELQDGVEVFAESVRGYIKDIDQHNAKAIGTLSGAIGELGEQVEELGEALGRREK